MQVVAYLWLCLVIIVLPVQAGKLYKIVDANGNVTFSQFPPEKADENAKVQRVETEGNSRSKVTRGPYGDYYCGEIALPDISDSGKYITRRLDYLEREWREDLDDKSKSLEQMARRNSGNSRYNSRYESQSYRDKNYQESLRTGKKRMRDLRCALDWAAKTRVETQDTVKDIVRMEGLYKKLKQELKEKCGPIPEYDPSDARASQARKDWYYCSKRYRQQLKSLKRKIGVKSY